MVDISEVYGSGNEYIKAEDIGNNMWTFTIRTADVKRFDDRTSKIILTFMEWEKGLPLNVTNARAIADLYGHDSNAWVGRQVMLLTMMVDYQGQKKKGIRIRAPMQAQPQPAQAQQYQPGAMQTQAATNVGGYAQQLQNSPQRPLNPPTGGYSELNPPPADTYR